MLFNRALIAAQTAFHFGDRATFVSAVRFAQEAVRADAEMVRQLGAAIVKFPTNEALEIVNALGRQDAREGPAASGAARQASLAST